MPREIVTLQFGQCGNQIGRAFWTRSLHEHASNSVTRQWVDKRGEERRGVVFGEEMSTFFRNVDLNGKELYSPSPLKNLKARACLVDTETGVLDETMRGPLRDLFDTKQIVTDVSGAGNNWAHGYYDYGSKYSDSILELIRRQAELCDSLQSFFLMHSLGGGTGSGLGTRTLAMLSDEYNGVYKFCTSVLQSEGDNDVVVAPYNTVSSCALRRAINRCSICAFNVLSICAQFERSMCFLYALNMRSI